MADGYRYDGLFARANSERVNGPLTVGQRSLRTLPISDDARLRVRERVYRACLAAIVEGRLSPGQRIPSARSLAESWGVARNTVDDALGQLQAEGLIVRRVGSGTFVATHVVTRPRHARVRPVSRLGKRSLRDASTRGAMAARDFSPRSVPRATPFAAGFAALDAFPHGVWRKLASRRWRKSDRQLLGYLPASGYPPLQVAIANHLAFARGLRCLPEQVMVLGSSMQAIDLIARVLLERGTSVWVEDPCYPNVRAVLAMAGLRVAALETDASGLIVERALLRRRAPALVCTTPSCAYPSGAVLSLARRIALLQGLADTRAWIVEDDHQVEFTWDARPLPALFALDQVGRTLYVNTFSHTMFPSLRLAYVVVPTTLIDVFHAVRRQLDDHTHGFMQVVLADFIADGHFSAHLRRMRTLYSERRGVLMEAAVKELPSLTLGGIACGLSATLALPRGNRDAEVAERAWRSGLSVLPLSRYTQRARGSNGLLLGYAALTESRIRDGIARLAKVLARAS
jgi:GntR family transcriptional regulator/MocR family aminotransferase